jgi:hypothetical protein
MNALGDLLKHLKRRAAIANAYHAIYALPAGKIVIDDLLGKSGLLEVSPAEDCRFYDGRRSMGLEILDAMRWSEGELVQLAKEQAAARVGGAVEQSEEAFT